MAYAIKTVQPTGPNSSNFTQYSILLILLLLLNQKFSLPFQQNSLKTERKIENTKNKSSIN